MGGGNLFPPHYQKMYTSLTPKQNVFLYGYLTIIKIQKDLHCSCQVEYKKFKLLKANNSYVLFRWYHVDKFLFLYFSTNRVEKSGMAFSAT